MSDAVQKRLATVTERDWNGEKVYLRKLGAKRTLEFLKSVTELKDKKLSPNEDRAEIIRLHATNISEAYCDQHGKLTYEGEQGIATLAALAFDDLVSLGDLVLNHSGFGTDEKKKYTAHELAAFRLCLAFGDANYPHPDYLLSRLTWEQFEDWNRFAEQEPWGEARADMRAAVNTLFANGGSEGLSLFWPYFPDAEAAWESHEKLEKRRQELGPEHEAKLKAARQKHIEEMKKRGR